MKVLVTGAEGFIGKNLVVRLREQPEYFVTTFVRGDCDSVLQANLFDCDVVIHLAGENRPVDQNGFYEGNVLLTDKIVKLLSQNSRNIPIILASSTQAGVDNPYGKSKLSAEESLIKLASNNLQSVVIYRLPGVFGKWCKPNYNSVVATFCHNISRGLPVHVSDSDVLLTLVYIDDVISSFLSVLQNPIPEGLSRKSVDPEYNITLGALVKQIQKFSESRSNLVTEHVGVGFTRALYATYLSYLPASMFTYSIDSYGDDRGVFSEILKTKDSGQFSFFAAFPGVTRGGHYHHTKSEKFLIVKGHARFSFRNIVTGEYCEIEKSSNEFSIVETIPGWSHNIKNIGDEELLVLLWASETFDRDLPDTIASEI